MDFIKDEGDLEVSIPMTVFGGLQSGERSVHHDVHRKVSIPMTVFGGLQLFFDEAGIYKTAVSIPMTVFGGLQCESHLLARVRYGGFNTDDGIWRAAIRHRSGCRCI